MSARSAAPALAALALFLSTTGCQSLREVLRGDRRGMTIDGEQWGDWVYLWPDGMKKAAGAYHADRQSGPWTYWYEDGQIEWQGAFAKDRLDGFATYWYPSGRLRAKGSFAAGEETGVWTFWDEQGNIAQQGDFSNGRRGLRWIHWYPDGAPRAEGYRIEGQRVGTWRYHDAAGALFEEHLPLPPGYELVREEDEAGVLREGFLFHGQPSGRWATRHPGGARRASGEFVQGAQSGRWMLWREDGTPLAVGEVEDGTPVGSWTLWRAGEPGRVDAGALAGASAVVEAAYAAIAPPEQLVGAWLREARAPARAASAPIPTPGAAPPSAELVRAIEREPDVPFRAQPWTVAEEQRMDAIYTLYSEGAAALPAGPAAAGYLRSSRGGGRSRGDLAKSEPLLGAPLPFRDLRTGEGEPLDLSSYAGKKLMLVVLRGFAGQVCIYCATQTEVIADNLDALEALGVEVVIVFPGKRSRLGAFVEAYRELTGGEELPLTLAYDPGFDLVRQLDIVHELARPSLFVLDEQGIVRYAFVGKTIDDRPALEDVLGFIEGMGGP